MKVQSSGFAHALLPYLVPLADHFFVSAAMIAAVIFLAHSVAPSTFGVFAVARNVLIFFGIVQAALMSEPMAVVRQTLSSTERTPYARSAVGLQILLMSVSALAAGLAVVALGLPGGVWLAIALSAACVSFQLREFVRFYYYSSIAFAKALARSATYFLILTLSLVLWHNVKGLSPEAVLWCLSLAGLLAVSRDALLFLSRTRPSLPYYALSRHAPFARWLIVGSICNFLYVGSLPIILASIGALSEAGGLIAAQVIVAPVQVLVAGVYNAVVPRQARISRQLGTFSIGEVVRGAFLVAVVAGGFLGVMAARPDVVLGLVYDNSYVRFSSVLRLFCLFYLIVVFSFFVQSALLSNLRPDLKGKAQLVGTIAASAVLAANISSFSAAAAVWVAIAGEATTLASALLFAFGMNAQFRVRKAPGTTPRLPDNGCEW